MIYKKDLYSLEERDGRRAEMAGVAVLCGEFVVSHFA